MLVILFSVEEVIKIKKKIDSNKEMNKANERKEERQRLFAKRTSKNAAMSAKERYLARKRVGHSVINDDD